MPEAVKKRTAYQELEALPSHLVGELIGGELYSHPRPAPRHSAASAALMFKLGTPFQDGKDGPGGWIFLDEPELHLGDNVVVPDLAAWRRERLAPAPGEAWIDVVPDWVCEVLSGSTEKRDRTLKMRVYGAAGVPHMWLIDPRQQLLEAFELRGEQWLVIGGWSADDTISVAPFDAVSFSLAALWPFDKPLGFNQDPQALYAGDR